MNAIVALTEHQKQALHAKAVHDRLFHAAPPVEKPSNRRVVVTRHQPHRPAVTPYAPLRPIDPLRGNSQPWVKIVREVCAREDLCIPDILGRWSARRFSWPRQEIMYRMSRELQMDFTRIGKCIGGRDRTAVADGIKSYMNRNNRADRRRDILVLGTRSGEEGIAVTISNVAAKYKLNIPMLLGDQRTASVIEARRELYWLLHQQGLSYSAIGRAVGNRDHTTILSGIRKYRQRMGIENSIHVGQGAQ